MVKSGVHRYEIVRWTLIESFVIAHLLVWGVFFHKLSDI